MQIHRGYYIPARGDEFYLRVSNSKITRDISRYRVEHEKIKFVSTSGDVIFCVLYKRTNDDDDNPTKEIKLFARNLYEVVGGEDGYMLKNTLVVTLDMIVSA